jgi:hypothetical protein
MELLSLPTELVVNILSFLSHNLKDVLHVREVCTYLCDIAMLGILDLNLRRYAHNITDEVLYHILSQCPQLENLCISNCKVTERIFLDLLLKPKLTGLHAYNVPMHVEQPPTDNRDHNGCTNNTEKTPDSAAQPNWQNTAVAPKLQPQLTAIIHKVIGRLRELTMGHGENYMIRRYSKSNKPESLEESPMHVLQYATRLVTLNMAFRTSRSFAGMRAGMHLLKYCSNIEKITVYASYKFHRSDTVHFSALPKLSTLLFASSALTTGAIESLCGCTQLRELYLHEVMVSSRSVGTIASIPGLQRLFLVDLPYLTDTGVSALSYSNTLEGIEIINAERITDEGITPLAACKNLRVLCLEKLPNVTSNVRALFPAKVAVVIQRV